MINHSKKTNALNEKLLTHLGNIIGYRNHEHQTWLSMFFTSLTTNALLLIALFSTGEFPKCLTIVWLIVMVAIFLSIILWYLQWRAYKSMVWYEKIANIIIIKIGLSDYYINIKESNDNLHMGPARLVIYIFHLKVL